MKEFFLFPLLIFSSLISLSQNKKELKEYELELLEFGQKILHSKQESERNEANNNFIALLEESLKQENSFEYPFDSLVTIAKLAAPDNSFRILNWHLPKDDGTFEFFCYIQPNRKSTFFSKSKKLPSFYKLINTKISSKAAENKVMNANEWYGAHYYKIIQPEKKDRNYVILGWDGNTSYSNKKVIDVLVFSNNGEPHFGAPIFKLDKKTQKRVIFEYAESASMSLKYHEQSKLIVFDHLAPTSPQYKDHYEFYGPDLSYDALFYKKGIWFLKSDIDVKTIGNSKEKIWNNPKSK